MDSQGNMVRDVNKLPKMKKIIGRVMTLTHG